jgi:DHA2 family multidrug resistance protein
MGSAGRRHRLAAVRARQGAAGRLVREPRPSPLLAVVAGVALTALIIQQLVSKSPIVDLRLFKDRSYAVGRLSDDVLGFVLYGSLVLLPVMLQTLFGFSSYQAGQAMMPRGVGSLVMMPTGRLSHGAMSTRESSSSWGLAIGGGTLLWLGQIDLNAATGRSSGRSSFKGPGWRCCSCR